MCCVLPMGNLQDAGGQAQCGGSDARRLLSLVQVAL